MNTSDCFQYIKLFFLQLWHNLKRSGEINIYDEQDNATVKRIHAGNYALRSLGKELEKIFDKEKVGVKFDHEKGSIFIDNPLERKIHIDRDLTSLLGLIEFGLIGRDRKLKKTTVINRLASFNNYFVNCDLINRDENLFSGNPSNILGCFEIVGEPFERVTYSPKEIAMRKIKSNNHIPSMRIWVTDENSKLPLRFEIEIL